MKKIVSPDQVAHLWANKLQDEASNSGRSLYFDHDKIYSYGEHFCIARHAVNEETREHAVLFTIRSYSNTTAKHIYVVQNASNHLNKIYCPYPGNKTVTDSLEYWLNEAEQIAKKLLKAKKPEIYLNQLSDLKAMVEKYCAFMNADYKSSNHELSALLETQNKEQYLKYADIKIQAEKERQAKIVEEQKKEHSRQLKRFRAGKGQRIHLHNGWDYLRFNSDKNRIETSQNVEIPAAIAHKFYNQILNTIKKGGCVDCDKKLMEWDVKEINKTFIEIGCHKVSMKEVNAMAKKLNWA